MNYSVVPHDPDGPNAFKTIKTKIIETIEASPLIKEKKAYIATLREEVKCLIDIPTAEKTRDLIYSSIATLEIELEVDIQCISDIVQAQREAGNE